MYYVNHEELSSSSHTLTLRIACTYVVHIEILPRALMCLAAAAALLCLTYMLGYGKQR